MDRTFLGYYEEELAHVRELAGEFAALHPVVARNLSLASVPCPDPYVERLLEGVAYLAARTRLKVDGESTRYVEALLDVLAPDLLAPGPACSTVVLRPGPQVQAMPEGHLVRRGTRLVAAFREGLATRALYTTAQDVTLWPIRIEAAEVIPDRASLMAAGLGAPDAQAAVRIVVGRDAGGAMAELALDRLDLHLGLGPRGGLLFDALHGQGFGARARPLSPPGSPPGRAVPVEGPALVGFDDAEALLPPTRQALGGTRLLREYFLMPERFHFLRVDGLAQTVAACTAVPLEVVILLRRPCPEIADLAARDLRLFATPVVNLFERECDVVDLDPRRSAHPVHPDRTRPRDFEVYRLLRVEDAESGGPEAAVAPLHGTARPAASGARYTTERRPRRPGEDEIRRGQLRTSYPGDDLYVSVSADEPPRALDIRALCTNRDLAILDDSPALLVESGDPVSAVELLAPMRRPVAAAHGRPPRRGAGGEARHDDVAWRLVSQLALNHLSLADATRDAEPLRALLALYADRGDPAIARHAQAIRRVESRRTVERLGLPGPLCFGHGVEVALTVDEAVLAGGSVLLLSAVLSRLFARHVGINGVARTRARLLQRQEEVAWPVTLGARALI